MEINSSLSSGLQVFQQARRRIAESSSTIANSVIDGSPEDLAPALIDLKVAEQQAAAGAKIIEVESKQVGTLLDLLG